MSTEVGLDAKARQEQYVKKAPADFDDDDDDDMDVGEVDEKANRIGGTAAISNRYQTEERSGRAQQQVD
jgi:hypothetical protein